jgi:FkbM family methyltransferase
MKQFYYTYVEKFKSNPVTILEIGSRDGDDAEALRVLSSADCGNVYIVEPHPDSYRNIINKYPLANVYNFAISNKPGVLDFNAIPLTYPQSVVGTSSLLRRNRDISAPNQIFPEQWIKVLAVTGTTLLELINRHEIDIVKIDVEGFTFEVLQSFGDNVRLMKALHLEVEIPPLTLWEEQKHYADVQYVMRWYGFEEKYYDGKYWGRIDAGGEKLQGDSVWIRND